MGKKKEKDLEHATATWEKEQVQAAALLAEVEKSAAVIDGHRSELTDEQYLDLAEKMDQRRDEIKSWLMERLEIYVTKCRKLGFEPVISKEAVDA
jgi:L-lactate utilization protein LutB